MFMLHFLALVNSLVTLDDEKILDYLKNCQLYRKDVPSLGM